VVAGTRIARTKPRGILRPSNAVDRFDTRRPTLAVPFAITLALWLILAQWEFSLPILLGVANCFICVRQIILVSRDPQSGPIQMVFWPFTFVWACASSLVQLHRNLFPWPDSGQEPYFAWAQLLLTVSLFAYIIGSKLARPSTVGTTSANPGSVQAAVRAWIPLSTAAVFTPLVLAASGGLSGRFSTRDDLAQSLIDTVTGANTVKLFLLNRLPGAAALIGAYLAAYLWSSRKPKPDQPFRALWAFARLVLALGLVALLSNPFSSSRYAALGAIFAIFLGLFSLKTPARRRAVTAVITVSLITIYPLANYFKKTNAQVSAPKLGTESFTSIDFDGYQQTVNTLSYVHQQGYAYGTHLVSAIGYFVPRSIWTGKATPANIDVAASRGYSFQNLSLPLWAELYLDLGLVGLVILMAWLGWLSRSLDAQYARHPGSTRAHLAVLFAVSQTGLIRGPLGGSMVTFGTVMVLGFVSVRVGAARSRNAQTARSKAKPDRKPLEGVVTT
jgi:hypothetical protein